MRYIETEFNEKLSVTVCVNEGTHGRLGGHMLTHRTPNFQPVAQLFTDWAVTFIWLWNFDIETKRCRKTKDRRDEIHENHSKIHFIRPVEEMKIF
jgi:hypothetical protein